MMIVIYVDNILIISSNLKEIIRFGENLSKIFNTKDFGNLK